MNQICSPVGNRKDLTKMLLVQWSRFPAVSIELSGSTLFTGVNGSGKSTILDALTYVLTGNTQFNKAAKDKDRDVKSYVRGDTKSGGAYRYLRNGAVISYVVLEFWSHAEQEFFVVGVCMESPDENNCKSHWFIKRGVRICDVNFYELQGEELRVTPKMELFSQGSKWRAADFLTRDKGVEQVMRALGLRCKADKYRSKLLKMMAFNPENNIDHFIKECVLDVVPITTLLEIREQKQKFDEIRDLYGRLIRQKDQLEQIERQIEKVEAAEDNIHIKEIMLSNQILDTKRRESEENREQIETYKRQAEASARLLSQAEKEAEQAQERYRVAKNNRMGNGLSDSVALLSNQIDEVKKTVEEQEGYLRRVTGLKEDLARLLEMMEPELNISLERKNLLLHLDSPHVKEEDKHQAFLHIQKEITRLENRYTTEKVHLEDTARALEERIGEISDAVKTLERNKITYPPELEKTRDILVTELKKKGIETPVRFFSELVKEVVDPAWRDALEAFLGRKKYNFIVDGEYCHAALEVMQEKRLKAGTVIITDKLPDTQVCKGSAAGLLTIPNPFARRYANYLCNGIHLCDSLEELHENPLGGMMKDGMLAKSYAVSYMNLRNIRYDLGAEAVRLQLQRKKEELDTAMEEREKVRNALKQQAEKLQAVKKIDWRAETYHFEAAERLPVLYTDKKKLENERDIIENDPEFKALLEEQERAEKAVADANETVKKLTGEVVSNRTLQEQGEKRTKQLAAELALAVKEFEEICILHLELKKRAREEYTRLLLKKPDGVVIAQNTIHKLRGEEQHIIRDLEEMQIEYCKLAGLGMEKRGVAFIPFYRKERGNIINVKAEETRRQMEEKQKNLESAFMNDFVAELAEAMGNAKDEINLINRELRKLPFGRDIYTFRMTERPEKAPFFRIVKKMEDYMNNLELYLASNRQDDELEQDIQSLMTVILDGADEEEFADYRSYFKYDMEITNRQGEEEIKTDLSRKQGSASNGEKQTPYFIILAASLMQCYPRESCCARLAFIDEAFSALSRERIEQMVYYFEQNGFQVLYAAPPEKISSIGSFINSTVSLVETGRYTNVVEGLVDEFIES